MAVVILRSVMLRVSGYEDLNSVLKHLINEDATYFNEP